jgi:hypothetical protein
MPRPRSAFSIFEPDDATSDSSCVRIFARHRITPHTIWVLDPNATNEVAIRRAQIERTVETLGQLVEDRHAVCCPRAPLDCWCANEGRLVRPNLAMFPGNSPRRDWALAALATLSTISDADLDAPARIDPTGLVCFGHGRDGRNVRGSFGGVAISATGCSAVSVSRDHSPERIAADERAEHGIDPAFLPLLTGGAARIARPDILARYLAIAADDPLAGGVIRVGMICPSRSHHSSVGRRSLAGRAILDLLPGLASDGWVTIVNDPSPIFGSGAVDWCGGPLVHKLPRLITRI